MKRLLLPLGLTIASVLIARGDLSCKGHSHLINPATLEAVPNWQRAIGEQAWRQEWVLGNREKEPSDYYFEAWLLIRMSEGLNQAERLHPIRAALDVLNELQKRAPDWKSELVRHKIEQVAELQKNIEKKQTDQQAAPSDGEKPSN